MKNKGLVYKSSGKILVAGGYGVLEQENIGISLAVNRHFYALIEDCSKQSTSSSVHITISSPQIKSQWIYKFNKMEQSITQQHGLQNIFVENAVKYSLKYAIQMKVKLVESLSITILFDRGFLSQSQDQSKEMLKFINYSQNVPKTGLGSSACVLAVIVRSVLSISLPSVTQIEINSVSQVANVAAQNKIGSNFDISTAVFGSQLYKNKLPKKAFESIQKDTILGLLEINPQIVKINPNPNIKHRSCCFMIDLKKGSNTRTMVGSFIKTLHSLNYQLIQQFYSKSKSFTHEIFKILESSHQRYELIDKLRQKNLSYRQFLQDYSKYTNVPIEPPEFKQLLDTVSRLNGVSYVICPGSGGYDAIFVLALPQQMTHKNDIKKEIELLCHKYFSQSQIYEVGIEWEQTDVSEQDLADIKAYLNSIL